MSFPWIPVLIWLALSAGFGGLAPGSTGRSPQTPAAGSLTVRFHHVHYRVGDPSAAMNVVAPTLDGVRVIVPGLGVGVRAGHQYLLFDRLDESDSAEPVQPPLMTAYKSAAAWLTAHRLVVAQDEPPWLQASGALPESRYHHIGFVAEDLPAVVQALASAGARIVRMTGDTVLLDAGSVLVEIVRHEDREETFWCPMHPDVRSADGGKCPLCGMSLVPIPPPRIGEYNIDVTQVRGATRGAAGLTVAVREPDSNTRVTRFAVAHEKLLHLFVVGRDLKYFAHVHPEQVEDGSFVLKHPLPPGEYMLIADFVPEGGTSQMVQKAIIVPGRRAPLRALDESQGLLVRLEAQDLAAGAYACLRFTVTDAKTGAPVTDLQPYLGAPAHALIVRGDLTDAIHAHPEEPAASGPTVSFHPLMPAAGVYRIWIQFQRAGQVSTTSFDLTVPGPGR